jgi:catechol 2,3-dioxygenase-like lactoylglutathione lyase family enzyme
MIELDHTIVPVTDKWVSATFLASLLGLAVRGEAGQFVQLPINERLTLDFHTDAEHKAQHYAFRVDAEVFEAIVARIRAAGVPFGSGPGGGWNGQLYLVGPDRGVYFPDPCGHVYEVISAASAGTPR